jgi:hypothetical protein
MIRHGARSAARFEPNCEGARAWSRDCILDRSVQEDHIMCIGKSLSLIAGLGLVALANCSHEEAASQSPAANLPPAVQDAVERISNEQCEYHQRCGDIGEHKKYSDHQHCMTVQRDDAKGSFGNCRNGVDQKDVSDCLSRIHEQGCGGIKISLWKQCSSDNLCLH